MEQLIVHFWADYVFQSDHMAMNKSKRSFPCLVHVLIYTSLFLLLTTSWKALLVIGGTHFILDRFPIIIRRLIWMKNHLGPNLKYVPFSACDVTGYYDTIKNEISGRTNVPPVINGYAARLNYVTLWLYIITDNVLHITINYLAIRYLG